MLGQLMGSAAGVARVLLDREAAIVGHRPVPVVPIRRSEPASLAPSRQGVSTRIGPA